MSISFAIHAPGLAAFILGVLTIGGPLAFRAAAIFATRHAAELWIMILVLTAVAVFGWFALFNVAFGTAS